jgi:D-glycero-alpha-D-manno-heptose-7-phosphate kinase
MIVARSPYRISFFGGGTDYADWYSVHGGAFLSMAINYYTYITLRVKPKFQEKEFRVLWRLAEEVKSIDDIKHPIVRETLKEFNYDRGLDISYIGDLPGGSGMGSSSAFTAALIKSIYDDMKKDINPYELAQITYEIESKKLKEVVGIQDQIATAFGGFNCVKINKDSSYVISPVNLSTSSLNQLTERMILVYTGQTRRATSIAESQVKNMKNKTQEFSCLQDMVEKGMNFLLENNIDEFGKLLHEAWIIKRDLSSSVTNNEINTLYNYGMQKGALGGKILGAGGGGFLLFICKEGDRKNFISKLKNKVVVPVKLSTEGTKIVYSEKNKGIE